MEVLQVWTETHIKLCGILFCVLCVGIIVFSEWLHYRRRLKADGGIIVKKTEGAACDTQAPNVLVVMKDDKKYKILTADKEFNSYKVGDLYHRKKKPL